VSDTGLCSGADLSFCSPQPNTSLCCKTMYIRYCITLCVRLRPCFGWYSLCLPTEMAKLSWPGWLVTSWDGLHAQRRSPIPTWIV